MKLKELDRTATTCWAPFTYQQQHSICPMLATGSVAGAMDASFSATTELEIFAVNLDEAKTPQDGLVRLGRTSSTARFVSGSFVMELN